MHEQWGSFFLAEAGAAAALTGLLFVAVSINLREIVADPALPGRAGETMAMLTGSLVAASMMLIPVQTEPWLGVELAVVAVITGAAPVRAQILARRAQSPEARRTFPTRVAFAQLATLPAVIAALLLIVGSPAGFAALAVGILMTFVVAILNAWVLLVEILR